MEWQVKMMNKDNVNHPEHYANSCSLECIDAMLIAYGEQAVYDFCICNAFKYLWRHKNKNGLEDLFKADWYIKKAKELRVKCNDSDDSEVYIDNFDEQALLMVLGKAIKEIKTKESNDSDKTK